MRVLVIDIGGSHVKVGLADQSARHQFDSSPALTPQHVIDEVARLSWSFDVISLGYPGRVGGEGAIAEPGNLGDGWVGFDFARAFGRPVRVINDAAMQALGAYEGGRMLFLGLGTGLGSTLVTERVIVPLELGDLPVGSSSTLAERLGRQGLERDGFDAWNRAVLTFSPILKRAFLADYVVLGGGNAGRVEPLPATRVAGGMTTRWWAAIVCGASSSNPTNSGRRHCGGSSNSPARTSTAEVTSCVPETERTMWQHDYAPVGDSLGVSAAIAALPLIVLFAMLGVLRRPSWVSALTALGTALLVSLVAYGMPAPLALMSTFYGAAYGLFPIAWIVFSSIMLYRLAVETGKFEIIKDSVGSLTDDRRLQAMFIAFSFGAFIEGAAGFGAPVAVSGAMLAGLGFNPFYAAGICLLANTAPVAFGSIGIPVTTLAAVTGLPVLPLSAMVGRLCAMVSVIIPGYLIVVMAGPAQALEVLPAIIACGVSFAGMQLFVSNYIGPELTDIMSSLTCIVVMVVVLKLWRPKHIRRLEGDTEARPATRIHAPRDILLAWLPYLLLVVFVLAWGEPAVKLALDRWTHDLLPSFVPRAAAGLNGLMVPGLHNLVTRVPPVVAQPAPYAAVFTWNWLSASGTACFLATLATAAVLGVAPSRLAAIYKATFKQLAFAMLTIASMLGLAYLMNYSGMTSTLGLALAGTGVAFPFFSAVVGWMGVFLTGSDTSANALFGNLQVVTANALGLNPVLTASVNSAAGVMGKMISVQSIAVAVAATGMTSEDESRLFRFTIRHSVLLMVAMGIISMIFAYVLPEWVPTLAPK